ncbi:hypothetical protein CK203_087161 [Vitis vinifera]|uniref:Uncharacterized protein n=1 Tax=Vitis vinifera TaxID=29760 RepID=A0A438D8V9_VITVI|nr:hypothetical protein CK203_087161 [Vitis vinifera]
MEGKQLNFSAPLLSVRRISSTLGSSDGQKKKMIENPRPNRQISIPSYIPYSSVDQVTEPVAVPFRWEQIPGRAKDGSEPEPQLHDEELSSTPRVPPGRVFDVIQKPAEIESDNRNIFRPQNETSSLDENFTNLEGLHEEGDSDNDSAAMPILMRLTHYVKPSGTFSIDPQTRDLMMNRFLPAAKAMVLETPHYASRKQSVVLEQPRQVKRVISEDTKPSLNKYSTDIIPYFGQYEEEEGRESEDEHDEYDASGNIPGCGLIPRFCLKNSLCLLDPVPGMKVRTRVPKSSARVVKKLSKHAYVRDHDRIVTKNAWDAFRRNQLDYEVQSSKLHEVGNMMTVESNCTYSSDSQATDGSSPHRHSSSGGGISPYRNEAPHSPFHEGMGFLGVPIEVDNFKADSYSDTKELIDTAGLDFGTLVERRGIEEASSAESSFQDIRCLNISKGGILKLKAPGSVDSLPSSSDIPHINSQEDTLDSFRLDQGLDQEFRSLEFSKGPIDGNLSMYNEQILKADDQVDSNVTFLQSPVPPALPKSPSESWLWRTVSLQKPHQRSKFHPRKQAPKTSSTDTKWETIVKTSKLHYDHVRYSEELIAHVPQLPKT